MHDSNLPGYLPFFTILVWTIVSSLAVVVNLGPAEFGRQLSETGRAQVPNASPLEILLIVGGFFAVMATNIYLLCRRSTPHENQYGPNPQEVPQ